MGFLLVVISCGSTKLSSLELSSPVLFLSVLTLNADCTANYRSPFSAVACCLQLAFLDPLSSNLFPSIFRQFIKHLYIVSYRICLRAILSYVRHSKGGWAAVRRRPIAVLLRQQQVCITHRPVVEVFISSESYLRAISSFLAPMQRTLTRWAKTDPFLKFQQTDSFGLDSVL